MSGARGADAVHLTCFFRTPSGDHAGGQMWRLTWIVFVSLFIYGTSAQGKIPGDTVGEARGAILPGLHNSMAYKFWAGHVSF